MIKYSKSIIVNGKPVGDGKEPLICAPLVGRKADAILSETEKVIDKKPDLLEWRADYFTDIADLAAVLKIIDRIKKSADDIPLIFTCRSVHEGGEPIVLSDDDVVEMYTAICQSGNVAFIDYEQNQADERLDRVRRASQSAGIKMILSYHDFHTTPPEEVLASKFAETQQKGADIAKIAVMPNALEDVLILLKATIQARRELDIPIISISMGEYGMLSRMFGWTFGSSVAFAVAEGRSAPGQIAIEDLKSMADIADKYLNSREQ